MIKIPSDMHEGTIFKTNNCGSIRIVEYNGWDKVDIIFAKTGHSATVRVEHIRSGAVNDPLYPSVYGLGFMGVGEHYSGTGVSGVHSVKHKIWNNMFKRCYGGSYPSYKDCYVCEEWHNFQNFASWYEDNHPNDGKKYDLDKDIKVDGNKIYHPDLCLFVYQGDNKIKAKAKSCTMISPKGERVEIYNVTQFCKDNKLTLSSFNQVTLGRIKQFKGWSKA